MGRNKKYETREEARLENINNARNFIKNHPDWYCEICNKSMRYSSKSVHINKCKKHLKLENKILENKFEEFSI